MVNERATYTFRSCLGQGGFGEVYLAEQHLPGGLTTPVAVKLLKADLDADEFDEAARRLRDEAHMLSLLDHPALIRVLQLTRIEERLALVTEYVDGVDVSRYAAPERLMPPKVTIGVIGEVAAALNTAWNTVSPETGRPLQLVHRDVKPENIRLGRHGEVKLLDFGLARTTEIVRNAQTRAGQIPLAHGYTAPETFQRSVRGWESDCYCLGVTLYRLLTGKEMFEGVGLAQMVLLGSDPPAFMKFLAERLAALPIQDATELLVGMLSPTPEGRPAHDIVQKKCEAISDQLTGPGHVRWARSQRFDTPTIAGDPGLIGKTLASQPLGKGLDMLVEPKPSPPSKAAAPSKTAAPPWPGPGQTVPSGGIEAGGFLQLPAPKSKPAPSAEDDDLPTTLMSASDNLDLLSEATLEPDASAAPPAPAEPPASGTSGLLVKVGLAIVTVWVATAVAGGVLVLALKTYLEAP